MWVRLVFPAALAVLLLIACAHIEYPGRSDPPTERVDLYFDEAAVTERYEVMGQVIARASDLVSAEKLQNKIVKKAQESGANAVIITGLDRHTTGEETSYRQTTKERRRGTEPSGSSTTTATSEKEIRATFVRYR